MRVGEGFGGDLDLSFISQVSDNLGQVGTRREKGKIRGKEPSWRQAADQAVAVWSLNSLGLTRGSYQAAGMSG